MICKLNTSLSMFLGHLTMSISVQTNIEANTSCWASRLFVRILGMSKKRRGEGEEGWGDRDRERETTEGSPGGAAHLSRINWRRTILINHYVHIKIHILKVCQNKSIASIDKWVSVLFSIFSLSRCLGPGVSGDSHYRRAAGRSEGPRGAGYLPSRDPWLPPCVQWSLHPGTQHTRGGYANFIAPRAQPADSEICNKLLLLLHKIIYHQYLPIPS